jgi:hypothetical protein
LYAVIPRDEQGALYDQGGGRNPAKFGFCAYPAPYGSSGRLTFVVNESNIIYRLDTRGKPVQQFPALPEAEAWKRCD